MNKNDKIFLIASFAVIILLIISVGSLYMMKEGERDKKMELQKQVDSLTMEKQNLESKLKETEIVNAQTAANIKIQEEKISMLLKNIEEEKASNSKSAAEIKGKEVEIQNLKGKIEEIRAEKMEALRTLNRLNEAYLNLKFQLENLTKTREELENKAKELAEKEGVSLGTVVIKRSNY